MTDNTNLENLYPERDAVERWTVDEKAFSIVAKSTVFIGNHYCGYVRFPKRPVKEESYNGFLAYVPVHGGITYAREDKYGMVYGFDCAHAGDGENPWTRDIGWLKTECEKMATGIEMAAEYEERYLLEKSAENEAGKATVIDEYHKKLHSELGIAFDTTDNFGAMINLLFGDL